MHVLWQLEDAKNQLHQDVGGVVAQSSPVDSSLYSRPLDYLSCSPLPADMSSHSPADADSLAVLKVNSSCRRRFYSAAVGELYLVCSGVAR